MHGQRSRPHARTAYLQPTLASCFCAIATTRILRAERVWLALVLVVRVAQTGRVVAAMARDMTDSSTRFVD